MNPNPTKYSRSARGFTLTELLVVITIIVILAALAFMGYGTVRERAQLSTCAGNIRIWGVAIQGYAAEHNGAVQWNGWASISSNSRYYETSLGGDGINSTATMNGKRVLMTQLNRRCPGQTWDGTGNGPVGYAMTRPNPKVPSSGSYNLNSATNPSQLLLMIDALALNLNGPGDFASAVQPLCNGSDHRHHDTVNALFADGHVSAYKLGDLSDKNSDNKARLDRWFTLK